MDKKVQKIKIEYAKYRTNGFLLDFIVKALNIEQKDEKFQKIYQRFVKEEEISADEYNDTLHTIIEDILFNFFDSRDNKLYKYYEIYLKEFFSFYNLVKIENETLATSQKQLEFINLITLFIPIFRLNIFDEKTKLILANIFKNKELNAIQSLFSVFKAFLNPNEDIKKLLYNILDSDHNKLIAYDSIYKNINNWIDGKTVPNNEHIELISNLALSSKYFTKNELKVSFKIAKLIQYLYDKSIEYFGTDLTYLLTKHYEYFDKFHTLYEFSKTNKKEFEIQLKKYYPTVDFKYIGYYLDVYFYNKIDLQRHLSLNAITPDIYIAKEHKERINFMKENRMHEDIFYKINEKSFFDTIDTILAVRYFDQDILYDDLIDLDITLLDKQFIKYSENFAELYISTLPNKIKTEKTEKIFFDESQKFEDKYITENNPYFAFLQARYYAQKREYKKSTEYYLIALKYGKNCLGQHIQSVINEGLIVSAQNTRNNITTLENKGDFTKFYKEAFFYKLIDDLPQERNINFLNDTKKQFDIHFKNLFPNIKKANHNIITPNFAFTDVKNITIDYNKPNKLIKLGFPNPITQLMYCAHNGNYECVKKLINTGADVNQLKSSDKASALLLTFPPNILSPLHHDAKKILKLLIPIMSKESLNTQLIKQKESALSYAIEYGLTDIVQLLIDNDVNLNKRMKLDDFTALYFCISCIGLSNRDEIYPENSNFNIVKPMNSKEEMKKLAKANIFGSAIFDKDREEEYHKIMHNEKFKQVQKETEEIYLQKYKERREKYYEIFDLLLLSSERIDIKHKNNFTPLIYATEINEELLVVKLLNKGANIDWFTDAGHRAYDYALVNKNKKLMELLE